MDNTKFLKTLLAVVEKQQAALKKMAAKKMGQGSPFYEGTDDPKDPNYWDPLNSTIKRDPSVPGPVGVAKPMAPAGPGTAPGAAPVSDLAAKVNANPAFAKLKGNLQLTQDPKNPKVVDVKYYTGAWNQGATNLQKALTSALPGYTINNPVGFMKLDFQANV